jgi:hypothetical protein
MHAILYCIHHAYTAATCTLLKRHVVTLCRAHSFLAYHACPFLHADDLLRPAAALAAALLDVTCTMGRLSAAGISFNTQPSPAAVAAAIDLAAQVNAALMPFQYKRLLCKEALTQQQQQQQQQPTPLPPLYLGPLQQQQEETFKQTFLSMRTPDTKEQFEEIITVPAQAAMHEPQQFWSLGVPLICVYGSRLLQHWEQQLQQQLQQEGAQPSACGCWPAGAASCGIGSSSGPAWQEAEGLLLLGAAALEGPPLQQQQQQLQQRLALCRQYQQQFQQAATKLGLSSEVMAAVAAWFTEAGQYSSSTGSSSESAAASSDAAADCLSIVCTASLLFGLVYPLTQPSQQFSPAEQLLVANYFLQVGSVRAFFGYRVLRI